MGFKQNSISAKTERLASNHRQKIINKMGLNNQSDSINIDIMRAQGDLAN